MKKILHLISGLGKGGAELTLTQLLKWRQKKDACHLVISMSAADYYEKEIEDAGCKVIKLPFKKHPLSSFCRLVKELRGADCLCTWMYHANFVGYLAAKRAKVKRIVWCVRHSDLSRENNKKTTLFVIRKCAKWSKNVTKITYNGTLSARAHEAIGYAKEKTQVVANGCDCREFAYQADARASLQKELHFPDGKYVVLSAAKDAPIKDVPTFVTAFARFAGANENAVAVMCGKGIEKSNEALLSLLKKEGLKIDENVFLLGLRHDMPTLMSACDLYVLHSAGEAFPNTLLQAMACSALCLTTDVGDAAAILGQEDAVLPPKRPDLLFEKMQAMRALSTDEAKKRRQENRRRVEENYPIERVAQTYEEILLWD